MWDIHSFKDGHPWSCESSGVGKIRALSDTVVIYLTTQRTWWLHLCLPFSAFRQFLRHSVSQEDWKGSNAFHLQQCHRCVLCQIPEICNINYFCFNIQIKDIENLNTFWRSVNLRMTFWCHKFSKKTMQKFDEFLL